MKADHHIESKNKETNKNSRFENYNNCNRNSLEGFKGSLDQPEERISDLEESTIKVITSEKQKETKTGEK